ncbi:hypothetical protein ACIRSS_04245 [Amycolatopsis sp. NPDC101161]|uniref:hypothetical protein n=1 Tax=Amycolatopsis sp. NPDC101161 TaxID=3363940 RepID=UPI00382CFE34
MFENVRVYSGRPRHDARVVSATVLQVKGCELTTVEVLHKAVEPRRLVPQPAVRGVVSQDPFPWTAVDIARATDTLRALGEQWCGLDTDDVPELDWPQRRC